MKMLGWVLIFVLGPVSRSYAQEMKTNVYGYINSYWEQSEDRPVRNDDGTTVTREKVPSEFDVPDIHFITNSTFGQNYRAFLNLKAPGGEEVEVSNAWVEAALVGDLLKVRMGKLYRPFGLYNEILDAVPTYIGIEPPELFDSDHLLLTRTTNLMLHGGVPAGAGFVRYALTTGNDERAFNEVPLGADVHWLDGIRYKFGASYYTSGGRAVSTNEWAQGDTGSPTGGVLPWMDYDSYEIWGLYGQYIENNWTIQAAYYTADHNATRNAGAVNDLCTGGADLSSGNETRFNCGGTPNTDGDYTVTTYYLRAGYTFETEDFGDITPYAQWDFYENKEVVLEEDWGGDDEAGLADDGKFNKWTVGSVFRPVSNVAIKLDYGQHLQKVNGSAENYGEARFSFSYYFRL